MEQEAAAGATSVLSPKLMVTRETGTVGATVTGLKLSDEQPPEVRKALITALHEHGVLFVKDAGAITDDNQKRFAGLFGSVQQYDFTRRTDGDPVITVLDSEGRGNSDYGTDRWHTDGSALEHPPLAAVLRGVTIPETGGDTMWASMYAAYESLSSHYQRLLEELDALHTTESVYRVRPAARAANVFGEPRVATHPVVVRDPITQKKALYVNSNYTERILGLKDSESESLLRMLLEHVNTPDFHVRLKWDTETMVIWEERVTQHRAINDYVGRRILHRVTLDGTSAPAR